MHKPFIDTGNKRGEMSRLTCFVFDTEVHEDHKFYDFHFMDVLAGWWVSNGGKGGTLLKSFSH